MSEKHEDSTEHDASGLRKLLSQASDAGLDESKRQQIEQWLIDNKQACDDYVDFVTLEALLDQRYARTHLNQQFAASGRDTGAQVEDGVLELLSEQSPKRASRGGSPTSTVDHAQERSHLSVEESIGEAESSKQVLKSLRDRFSQQIPVSPAWLTAAAAVLLLAGFWLTRGDSLGTIVALEDVTWADGNHYAIGDNVGDDWIALEEGVVRIATRSTAMVSLRGPTRFRVVTASEAILERGDLTAHVPAAAVGFRVQAPDLSVVDLGTGFDLHVGNDGVSRVRVMEGRVRVEPATGLPPVELAAGEVVSYQRDAESDSGLRQLDQRELVPRTGGALSFNPEHPASLGYKAYLADDIVHVFLESSHLVLPHDMRVNHSSPGKYSTLELARTIVPTGTRVHSYLLHYSPESGRRIVQGSVTFPGKILGIVADTDRLNATNTTLGSAWTLRCNHPERGLESVPDINFDAITISPNRRKLSLTMRTESIDQLRVLVECDP